MSESWRTFDHTADLGLEVQADTPARLFACAALAVLAQVAECERPVEDVHRTLEAEGEDARALLVEWLNRALVAGELDSAVWTRIEIDRFDGRMLSARLWGPRRDRTRMTFLREVKAVSHHDLELVLTPGRCRCRIVIDL